MRHDPPLRRDAPALALAALALATGAVVLTAPGIVAEAAWTTWALQAAAQGFAMVACARAAGATTGRRRAAWALFAAGQGLWFLTDTAYAAVVAAGIEVSEVSAFDAAWLAYYLPTLGAVAIFYALMQPEPGWLGAIDSAVLTAAITVVAWAWVLAPIAASGSGGTAGTVVNSLYPGLDLLGLGFVTWIALRRRATPRWTLGLLGSFALSVVAGTLYLDSALGGDATAEGLSGVAYALASVSLAVTADHRRRHEPAAGSAPAGPTVPPAWSQLGPSAAVLPLAAIIALGGDGPVGLLALTVVLVVVARLSWSLLVLARMGQAHEALLRRDPLTGAHNRRFLGEELARLCARARRSGEPLAAIALDLDGFKRVNDTRGHAAGDALLVRLVSEIRVRLRSGDVLCRLGGDEFVVLLPDTDAEGALHLAGRVLEGVRATREALDEGAVVGGSLGVAALAGEDADPRALLARADAAMYASKAAGGARVVAWREGLSPGAPQAAPAG